MKSGATLEGHTSPAAGTAVPGAAALPVDLAAEPTRERVLRLILERGPQTAANLSACLDLSPTAIRRHLDALTADGLVTSREQRVPGQRGRGRPARVFLLTDAGRERFPHAYDDLALQALRYLRETGGDEAVMGFARGRLAVLVRRAGESLAGVADPEERLRALARVLSAEGYAAEATSVPTGGQLCQHHCPVAHVAAEFPALCEAETDLIAEVLGTHVQRLATIAHGDGVCTTHVPHTHITLAPVAARTAARTAAPTAPQSGRTA